ncbi:MAG: T9SS type A sorting domain-containing protein [Bacteroidota bacterium]
MQKLIIIQTIFLGLNFAAQSQQIYFNKIYDFFGNPETAFSIVPVDSGYLIAGRASDSSSWGRIALLYIDSFGNEIWKKSFGKENCYYYPGIGGSFIPAFDGGYALGGYVNALGNSDALLMKFDKNGDTLWTKTYGDSLLQVFYKCRQTSDSGYILIGTTNNGNDNDFWLVKTNSTGDVVWQRTYGGNNNQTGLTIDICNDGGFILGGWSWSNSTGYDTYIIKTDSLGNQQWSKYFGGNYNDCAANIIQSSDGGYIFTTCKTEYIIGPSNYKQIYIYKLDNFGNIEWQKTIGPISLPGGGSSLGAALYELNDGSFFAAGQFIDSQYAMRGWILKITEQGDSLWDRRLDKFEESDDRFLYAMPTDDGGYIAVGDNFYFGVNDTGILAGNHQNMWIVKLDSCGCLYPQYYPQPVAAFSYTVDSLIVTFTNQSDSAINYFWDFGDGTTSDDTNTTHIYQDSGVYIVTLIAKNCSRRDTVKDAIVISFTGIKEKIISIKEKISIYPNPLTEEITLQFNQPGNEDIKIRIYNVLGELVYKNIIPQSRNKVNLSDLPGGIYLLQLEGEKIIRKKIIKL